MSTQPDKMRPDSLLGWFVLYLFRLLYGFKRFGGQDLQAPGPILLIPNHVSWIDFLYVGVCLDSDWRFVTSSVTAETSWLHRRIMRSKRTFPIDVASPYAIKHIAEYLRQGGRLVLFAEGRLSRTGSLMKLFEGTGFLLLKTHAKVITCHLRGTERHHLSVQKGWTRYFPRISAHFSRLIEPPHREFSTTLAGRRTLTRWLMDQMLNQRFQVARDFGPKSVLEAVIENRYQTPGTTILNDITLKDLSYRKLLVGVELLAKQWSPVLDAKNPVGILLPNVTATPVTLLSLWGRELVPALLNYSSGAATMLSCCQLASIKQIITSRKFLEKARLDLTLLTDNGIELIFLEDIRARITSGDRDKTVLGQIFKRPFKNANPKRDNTAAILFTSGSEGMPKGVKLTHANLMANINQMLAVIDVTDQDRMFNALPLFHSFGLSIGTLLPLVRGVYTFLYPSPLHYRLVPEMVYDQDCTIMLATNTFLNGYARRSHPYDFQSVRYLFAGAEKTQSSTFKLWSEKYGIRILEGYGATECSPCISVNTYLSPKVGSAGRFLPGIEYRLEKVDGVETGGRLHVRGPNIMEGYLNPDANAAFKELEGWYDTGDIVDVDEAGFVHIIGRLKRFAKISGEMVSLTAIEQSLTGKFEHLGLRIEVVVLTQPDTRRGEKLIAIANHRHISLTEVQDVVRDAGHSNLSVPREIKYVKTIPKLGSGKTDYRTLESDLAELETSNSE